MSVVTPDLSGVEVDGRVGGESDVDHLEWQGPEMVGERVEGGDWCLLTPTVV